MLKEEEEERKQELADEALDDKLDAEMDALMAIGPSASPFDRMPVSLRLCGSGRS